MAAERHFILGNREVKLLVLGFAVLILAWFGTEQVDAQLPGEVNESTPVVNPTPPPEPDNSDNTSGNEGGFSGSTGG